MTNQPARVCRQVLWVTEPVSWDTELIPAITKILRDSRVGHVHMGDTVRGRRAGDQFDLQYVGWQTLHLHVEGLHHLKPGRVTPVSERRKAAVDSRPVALATGHLRYVAVVRVRACEVKGRTITKGICAPVNSTIL